MKQVYWSLPLAMVLTGCVSLAPLDEGLSALQGQPIESAYGVLGYPSSKLELGKVTVYSWKNESVEIQPYYSTTDTTGRIGRRTFNSISTSTDWAPAVYQCEIKLGVVDQKIINYDYIGSVSGCRPYLQKVQAYYQQ